MRFWVLKQLLNNSLKFGRLTQSKKLSRQIFQLEPESQSVEDPQPSSKHQHG
jgi:hypothetical protein